MTPGSDPPTSPPASVLCMGYATMDYIFGLAEIPQKPLKFRARNFKAVGGGNAATAAAAVARLGGRAHLIARLGGDLIGDDILHELDGYGIDTSLVQRFPGCSSSLSCILVDDRGERLVVNYSDPEISRVAEESNWLPQIPPGVGAVLTDAHWLADDLELFRRAAATGIPAILDADSPACAPELIRASTVAAFSAPGLEAATGVHGLTEGLRAASQMGTGVMLATAGADGVFWLEDGELKHQPAHRVEAVDTLGAGDVFHGAFALALAEGRGIEDAVRFANAAAAIKVTRFGGRAGTPTRAEVERLLAAHV